MTLFHSIGCDGPGCTNSAPFWNVYPDGPTHPCIDREHYGDAVVRGVQDEREPLTTRNGWTYNDGNDYCSMECFAKQSARQEHLAEIEHYQYHEALDLPTPGCAFCSPAEVSK